MSTWGIGDKHDSDEVQALKEQLRTKDAQYITLNSQLHKQEEEFKDFKLAFNDLHDKLRREADRALELEAILTKRSEELQNERLTRQNTENALAIARQKIQSSEQTARELHATLDMLSASADTSSADKIKLGRDNEALHAHVRELQLQLEAMQQKEQALVRCGQSAGAASSKGRKRSSSVSTFRATALEHEAADLRTRFAQQESEFHAVSDRLSRTQNILVQVENEKNAMERRLYRQLDELRATLEEREEDLKALNGTAGMEDAATREKDLLERLEDEEKRVTALESELARIVGGHKKDMHLMKEELDRTLATMEAEKRKVEDSDARLEELVKEKEEALDERDEQRREALDLRKQFDDARTKIKELESRTIATASIETASSSSEAETAETVQRLMSIIERLRGERDQLRRDLDFVKAESRFAMEDLQAKLIVATTLTSSTSLNNHKRQERAEVLQAKLVQREDIERRFAHCGLAATALAVVIDHVESQRRDDLALINGLMEDLANARSRLDDARTSLQARETQVRETQMSLANITQSLEATESQVSALKRTVEHLEEETLRERRAHEAAGGALAQAEVQVEDISRALTDAEAQRDTLALQLKHTEQDLQDARKELVEADTRYGQQLCAMSNGEATRALREQIEALEQRVLRRTEQIGVHQHDIKRLETNLRLQEERVAEMTAELEVVLGEKEAMVDDCKMTREERDEALRKCEELEEKMEISEQERDRLTAAASAAIASQGRAEDEIQAVLAQNTEHKSQLDDAQAELRVVEADRIHLVEQMTQLQEERESAKNLVEHKTQLLLSLQDEMDCVTNEARQATLTLAVIHSAFKESISSRRSNEEARLATQAQMELLQQTLQDKLADVDALQRQLEILRQHHEQAQIDAAMRFSEQKADLEKKLGGLQLVSAEMERQHQQEMDTLTQANEELRSRLAVDTTRSEAETDLRGELERIHTTYREEIESRQRHLEQISAELQETRRLHDSTVASHGQSEADLVQSKQELEKKLAEVTAALQTKDTTEDKFAQAQVQYESELRSLQKQLESSATDFEEAAKAHSEFKIQHQHTIEQLDKISVILEQKTQDYDDLQIQLNRWQVDHQNELKIMQNCLDLTNAELEEVKNAHAALDKRHGELSQESLCAKEQLENRLGSTTEEAEFLKAKLQAEIELHTRNQRNHELEIQLANEKRVNAEVTQEKLAKELSTVRIQLNQANASLQALQDEKTNLQFDITNLEAEIQKSKSLQRFLESQLKDSEHQIATLTQDLEDARGSYLRSEKACKVAEVNLSMREIQHEQTLAALRRNLSSLRANPKLEDKIAELEERNLEMEDLLRNKCLEIEENDDRFIEMLKEKKKLTSKVETLSRKVHSLQIKLTASSGTNPTSCSASTRTVPPTQHTASSSITPSCTSAPPVPSLPVYTPTTPTSNTHSKLASGSSALPRPKTPEVRVPQPPVFRARTPESKRVISQPMQSSILVSSSSSSSSSSVGMKRRAPDDFEDCESIPPQGFTTDSVPSVESTTPRIRRALHTVRTGFTPVRNHSSNSVPAHSSPTRRATTGAPLPAAIADVTNNPRPHADMQTAKTARRGWLGKIRSVPTQAPRVVSSRSAVFERGQR
ncbi:hypothetical protein AcW1_001086 [Taiwanofungus camphoratus]|nr:hypothetical protein AcW2_000405 [Antrodia cinnamomea]KAI0936994.1 hypothetical protein AcV5_005000 [Antrodia cinnamomea]KAI0964215.1 hypothetical protein AcW1_001086 [Antrodia cinnamomea]